jgi:phage-related protein
MADKFTDFGNSTKEKLKTALDNTKAKFTDIKAAFSQHNIDIGDQASKLVAKYSALKTDIANRIQEVKSSMRTKLSEMASTAKEGFENIASTIDNFTSTFLYVGRKLISKLWDGFLEIFRLIPGRVRGKISDVVESITNWKSSFKDAGKGLISSLWDGAKDKWSDFKRWMDSKLRTVRDFLPGSDAKFGPLSTLTDAGRGLFSAMQEGMAKQAPGFLKDVEGVVAKTRGIIPDTMNVTPGQLAYAGGSGSRQKQVVVQLNGGVYTNERDFDKLAQKVNENMNKQYRR